MNGVHDLGGMQGFGAVDREENEPDFHAEWERRMRTINTLLMRKPLWNIDEWRHGIERMGAARYLETSYYEHWLASVETLLAERGVISPDELDARTEVVLNDPEFAALPPASGAPLPDAPRRPHLVRREPLPPRYAPGDRIRTRQMHPVGHTRLPRYARGKVGIVERVHGTYVFPDSNAAGSGEDPQPLYSVRFAVGELWGDSADGRGSVNLDLWEPYLLPA